MAIAVGQTAFASTGNGASVTTPARTTQTTGSAFVLAVDYTAAGALTSVQDNFSNTYTEISTEIDSNGGSPRSRLFYKENGAGGAGHTATANFSPNQAGTILFLEITGGALTGILGANNRQSDAASPFTSPAVTNEQAAALMLSFVAGNTGSNPSAHTESNGFTIQSGAEELNGAAFWVCCLATLIVSTVASRNSSFTQTGSSATGVWIAEFKEAVASQAPSMGKMIMVNS